MTMLVRNEARLELIWFRGARDGISERKRQKITDDRRTG